MSEVLTVLEGFARNPKTIEADGKTYHVLGWSGKAAWQLLRLILGYETADYMVKKHKEELWERGIRLQKFGYASDLLYKLPASLFEKQQKPLQFILKGNSVVAVATTKHLLIPPSQVYETAFEIAKQLGIGVEGYSTAVAELKGLTFKTGEYALMEVGIQIFAGDILTNRAIHVSNYLRILSCLNPLSWLFAGSSERFLGYAKEWERVIRIKVVSELKPRLEFAMKNALQKTPNLQRKVELAKMKRLYPREAAILTIAFGSSYSLGRKVLEQVLEKFESEDKTCYGLAQAFSWVAAHGELRKTPEGWEQMAPQRLSTLAGVSLLTAEAKEDVVDRSLEWLKSKIREGKLQTYEELLQKWNIP